MKIETCNHTDTTEINSRIADIARRLECLDIGSDELAALEWLANHPEEFGNILRQIYRDCV